MVLMTCRGTYSLLFLVEDRDDPQNSATLLAVSINPHNIIDTYGMQAECVGM